LSRGKKKKKSPNQNNPGAKCVIRGDEFRCGSRAITTYNRNMKSIKFKPMRDLLLFAFILILLPGCETSNPGVESKKVAEAILVFNNKDTATIKFNQAIMELPEYKAWKYNQHNASGNMTGYAFFESRTLLINETPFYHIELVKQKFGGPTDSFMHSPGTVCYFRIDPADNEIKILDTKTKSFIPLMSENGRKSFKNCLQQD
jgi:hypothetical protein